jgi:hypothetical protein
MDTDTDTTDDTLDFKRVIAIQAAICETINNFDNEGVSPNEIAAVATNLLAMAVRYFECPHCRAQFYEDIKRDVANGLAEALHKAAMQPAGSQHVH